MIAIFLLAYLFYDIDYYLDIKPYTVGAGKKPNKFTNVVVLAFANALKVGETEEIIIPGMIVSIYQSMEGLMHPHKIIISKSKH